MLKIGITGGMGSGKSTVARMFQVLGVPVYFADDAGKRLMQTDPEIRKKIIQLFGPKSYSANDLNRSFLAHLVFNNPAQLKALNAIVHPAVNADSLMWMASQTAPYVLKEAALLFESGSYKHLDYIIGVSSSLALRIQRIQERDGIGEEQILSRMEKQLPENEKMERCDFLIDNNLKKPIIPQVLALHEKLLNLA